MSKKRTNKAGHVFGGHIGGIDYFRQDDGKWTDSGGTLVEPGYAKLLDQFFPQEVKDENTPPPPKKKRKRKPVIEPDEEDKPKKKRGRKPKPKSDEDEEDKSSVTSRLGKAALKSIFPDTYANISALREIISGNKDDKEKEKSQKKRDDDDKRREYETVDDRLDQSAGLLRDILSVQERSATLLAQIAQNIGKSSISGPSIPDLPGKGSWWNWFKKAGSTAAAVATSPVTAAVGVGALGAYGGYKAVEGLNEYSNIPNREDKNVLDASSTKPDGTEMTDAEMREQAFKQRGNRMASRPTNTAPVIPTKPNNGMSIQATGTGTVEELTAALNAKVAAEGGMTEAELREQVLKQQGQKLAGRSANTTPVISETKPPISNIATSKETKSIAAAKQKVENILSFEGSEIKFKSDRLIFDVEKLTVINKNQNTTSGSISSPGGSSEGPSSNSPGGNSAGSNGTGTGNVGSSAAVGAAAEKFNSNIETPASPGGKPGEMIPGGKGAYQGFTGKSPTPESVKEDLVKAGKFTGSSGTVGKTGNQFGDNSRFLMDNLKKDFGLSRDQAAAIIGWWGGESGLDPGINEKNPLKRGSRGGFGIAQWTGDRRTKLEEYATKNQLPLDSLQTQYSYFKEEVKKYPQFAKIMENVKNSKDLGQAIRAFQIFQTGGDSRAIVALGRRFEFANKALAVPDVKPMKTKKTEAPAGLLGDMSAGQNLQAVPSEVETKLNKPSTVTPASLMDQSNPATFGRGGGHSTGESFELTKSQREQQFGPPEPVTRAVPEFNVGANLLPPDATKLPGGDEGLKDRDVQAINNQNLSNKWEKEESAAREAASPAAGYETSFDVGTGPQGVQPVAKSIPEPPRRPADLTQPPEPPMPPRRPAESSKETQQSGTNARTRNVDSYLPKPGGNGGQFLETVFRMLPYLLHQKKHAPQMGRRWHY